MALNPIDAYYMARPVDEAPGRVLGSDVAGTIVKIGTDVTGWGMGDRVAGFSGLQGGTCDFSFCYRYPNFFCLKPAQ